jgi:glycosyltransferase involved in cell wall biosynthesis
MSPSLSIVIATNNSSQHIVATIESILAQQECLLDVIIVDAESHDGTLSTIASYNSPLFRVQSVPKGSTLFEMLNRGIKMASGQYIQFFFPGDGYLFEQAAKTLVTELQANGFPDLYYTACVIQDDAKNSHLFFRPFQKELLACGSQPTVLQACLIKKTIFQKIGYFNLRYEKRASFDFYIRFLLFPESTFVAEKRVYIELMPISMDAAFLIQNVKENVQIIYRYFGISKLFHYLLKQKEMKRLWTRVKRRFKLAFQRR